jgi:two-component system, OmpR family, KDP operon response regulator KdpE
VHILIIDDEPDIVETVQLCLKFHWPEVQISVAGDGRSGISATTKEQPDLVLLDIGLPDIDGYEVCRDLRNLSQVPIIMLTAWGSDADKDRSLEGGADDYIPKPFSHTELLARVRSVWRRASAPPLIADAEPCRAGEVLVDFRSGQVFRDGTPVTLTKNEYSLLFHLARNPGVVLPFRTLLAKVWGKEYMNDLRHLTIAISSLRAKLETNPALPVMLVAEEGVGYKFDPVAP